MDIQPTQVEQSMALVTEVKSLIITDQDSYRHLAGRGSLIKEAIKYFSNLFDPRIKEANTLLKGLRSDKAKYIDPLEEAEDLVKTKCIAWDNEQERIKKRREMEEAVAAKKKADDDAAELAALAEQAGEKELAEHIITHPEQPPPVVVAKETPKVKEQHFVLEGKYEVVDLMALAKDVVEGKAPLETLLPNKGFLYSQAVRRKPALGEVIYMYAGVKVWTVKNMAIG